MSESKKKIIAESKENKINNDNLKTVRIWMVWHAPDILSQLMRDGISRTMSFLAISLIKHTNVDVEFLSLSNYEDEFNVFIKDIKSKLDKSLHSRLKIVFYNNRDVVNKVNSLDERQSVLLLPSSNHPYIDQILYRNTLFTCLDLFLNEFTSLFTIYNNNLLINAIESVSRIKSWSENNPKGNILFASSFWQNKFSEIIKYDISDYNKYILHFPQMNIDNVFGKDLKYSLLEKYKIEKHKFIFHPTQNRPYKNFEVLLKALKILKDRGNDIKLVLTGKLEHFSPVLKMARYNDLMNEIVETSDLTSAELGFMYQNCLNTVACSLGEGALPLIITESLEVDMPVMVANAEYIDCGFIDRGFEKNEYKKYFQTFDIHNGEQLAKCIEYTQKNRQEVIEKQKNTKDKLLSFDAKSYAESYVRIFNEILQRNNKKIYE